MKYYNSNQEEIPSVTTLLKFVNNHLDNWANYMGFKGINVKDYLSEKASHGTHIHSLCDSYFHGVPINSEELTFKLDTIKELFSRKGYEYYQSEYSLSGESFGGTLDLVLYNQEKDDYIIIDFKTSKNDYHKHYLQLAGYTLLLQEVCNASVKAVCVILIEKPIADSKFINLRLREDNLHNEKILTLISNIYYECNTKERKFYYEST